jgi:hypothetical protein
MLGSAIAIAESRLVRSRADLGAHVHRLGIALARPAPLAGVAAAGALLGFAAMRIRPGSLTEALGATLRQGLSLYVRYRTAQRPAPSEDAAHG